MRRSTPENSYELLSIPVDQIQPNPSQVRRFFDEDELAGLAASIREFGVLQPVLLASSNGAYYLIAGERRWRAAKLAQLQTVPALVRVTEWNAGEARLEAALENIQRSNLSPMEVAAAYQDLIDELSCTSEALADRLGVSYQSVRHHLRLFAMPEGVQRRLSAGTITMGHAKALMGLLERPGSELIERLADRIVAEGLTVRQLEEQVLLVNSLPVYGGESRQPRRGRPGRQVDTEASRALENLLDTKVQVAVGKNSGTITIRFAGQDDLERILGLLAPGRPAHLAAS